MAKRKSSKKSVPEEMLVLLDRLQNAEAAWNRSRTIRPARSTPVQLDGAGRPTAQSAQEAQRVLKEGREIEEACRIKVMALRQKIIALRKAWGTIAAKRGVSDTKMSRLVVSWNGAAQTLPALIEAALVTADQAATRNDRVEATRVPRKPSLRDTPKASVVPAEIKRAAKERAKQVKGRAAQLITNDRDLKLMRALYALETSTDSPHQISQKELIARAGLNYSTNTKAAVVRLVYRDLSRNRWPDVPRRGHRLTSLGIDVAKLLAGQTPNSK